MPCIFAYSTAFTAHSNVDRRQKRKMRVPSPISHLPFPIREAKQTARDTHRTCSCVCAFLFSHRYRRKETDRERERETFGHFALHVQRYIHCKNETYTLQSVLATHPLIYLSIYYFSHFFLAYLTRRGAVHPSKFSCFLTPSQDQIKSHGCGHIEQITDTRCKIKQPMLMQ